ncbi:MAG: hypothetical protein PHF05_02140 [Candidatus Izemoplasmatales bacterium]|nr:hypothetical protein [Candidatus Izemoplasmatales bacterium]MDY0138529.1 hypothetical protein [Candidatus Izemoplasmatales bacterium]
MKRNIKKNILIDSGESIYKEFPKLRGYNSFCQLILTSKRLIMFRQGERIISKKKKSKVKGMSEVDIKSITNLEYYIEYTKFHFVVRILGFLVLLFSLALVYVLYAGKIVIPEYPYSKYLNYVGAGIVFLVGAFMLFHTKKVLKFRVISGFNIETTLELKPNKYNELALRYIASRLY